ncbi:hypothetical protein PR048_020798 [Dryococelus australis]|uniref:Uncharacterized protein n=1 Tax=Dryococelus australis TaxID=614101 RepID=A0ABQ9GWH4_9NEOP|nr:hypothetical protein PR048_020798 [Dryococelus australis]
MGGVVARALASHQGSIPAGLLPDFCMCESCWAIPLVVGFSQGSTASPRPLHSGTVSIPSPFTFICFQDFVANCQKSLHSNLGVRIICLYEGDIFPQSAASWLWKHYVYWMLFIGVLCPSARLAFLHTSTYTRTTLITTNKPHVCMGFALLSLSLRRDGAQESAVIFFYSPRRLTLTVVHWTARDVNAIFVAHINGYPENIMSMEFFDSWCFFWLEPSDVNKLVQVLLKEKHPQSDHQCRKQKEVFQDY